MKDVAYWKKEILKLHPLEYIDLLQAIQDNYGMKCKLIDKTYK